MENNGEMQNNPNGITPEGSAPDACNASNAQTPAQGSVNIPFSPVAAETQTEQAPSVQSASQGVTPVQATPTVAASEQGAGVSANPESAQTAPMSGATPGASDAPGQPAPAAPYASPVQTPQQPPASVPYAQQANMPATGMPYPQTASNGKATGALVCGILAILFAGVPIVSIILGIVAIVLATSYIKGGGAAGTAKAGCICGIVGIVLSVIIFIIAFTLGMAALTTYLDEASTTTSTAASSARSESREARSIADLSAEEQEAQDFALEQIDALIDGDDAMVSSIASLVDASLEESEGVTFEQLGVDPKEYVRIMIEGMFYEDPDLYLFSTDDEASFEVQLTMKDIYDVIGDFYGEFYALPDQPTPDELKAMGPVLLDAARNASMTDENLTFYIEKKGGEWQLDEESWESQMDYFFGL